MSRSYCRRSVAASRLLSVSLFALLWTVDFQPARAAPALEFLWGDGPGSNFPGPVIRVDEVGRTADGLPLLRGSVQASGGASSLVVTRGLERLPDESSPLVFVGKIHEQTISEGGNLFRFSVPISDAERVDVGFCLIDESGGQVCRQGAVQARKSLDSEGFVAVKRDESPRLLSRPKLDLGLSLTSLDYIETRSERLQMLQLTPKAGLTSSIGANWSVSAGGYFNLLPLVAGEQSLRFLGLNLRFGYRLPLPLERLTFQLFGGMYYITTFSPGDSIGFKDLVGPQIYPTVNWRISGDWSLAAYGKYSPVQASLGELPDFSNNEVSAGVGVRWKTHALQIDFSRIHVDFLGIYLMDSSSLSIGLSERF